MTNRLGNRMTSPPLPLKAGEKTPIRIEYAKMGKQGTLHLCWESASQEIEHVPQACLYPPAGAVADPEPPANTAIAGPSTDPALGDMKAEESVMPQDSGERLTPKEDQD